jgi:hypothetical protein
VKTHLQLKINNKMEARRNAYRILVEEPEGKKPLGRHRRRWENNIQTNLR